MILGSGATSIRPTMFSCIRYKLQLQYLGPATVSAAASKCPITFGRRKKVHASVYITYCSASLAGICIRLLIRHAAV